jgi:hypothetical protein
MQSDKFLELARRVAKKDRMVFDQLIEYEATKRIRTKTRMNFTIDRNVSSQFMKFCRRNGYSMSAKIEQAMEEMMKK